MLFMPTAEVFVRYDNEDLESVSMQDRLTEQEAKEFYKMWTVPGKRITNIYLIKDRKIIKQYDY